MAAFLSCVDDNFSDWKDNERVFCESKIKYKYLACLILICNRYSVIKEDEGVDSDGPQDGVLDITTAVSFGSFEKI